MDEFNELKLAKLTLLKAMLEKRDTIRVICSASGHFSFEVKRSFDASRVSSDVIIEQIEGIYAELKKKFRDQNDRQ